MHAQTGSSCVPKSSRQQLSRSVQAFFVAGVSDPDTDKVKTEVRGGRGDGSLDKALDEQV